MPHLYLVDGSGYIFRAYHRLPPLTNKHGEPVGAVYGYTTMLWKLADEVHKADGPTHMAVILDKSSKTFRNDLYDKYKAQRPPPPEDLVPQFPMIRDATRAFSLPCIETEGLEADDIIACYAKAALAQGWEVTIVSSDKDLMQLIEPGLDLYDTMNNRRLSAEHVAEKFFGITPMQLGDVLALMGDSVDNVPGVPGVGPKTAAKLILEHGDLEAVLAAAPAMKAGKLRDNLIEHTEMARLSKILVTLKCDVALPEPLDDLELKGIPDAPLRAFLDHHGFRSLLTKLDGVNGASPADPPVPQPASVPMEEDPPCDHDGYETVGDLDALDRWIAIARHQGWIAIDTETTGVDATRAELVGVSLALHPNLACYVPLGHGGSDMFAEVPPQIDRALALARLKDLFEDPSVLKIGHNLKYDMIVLGLCDEVGGIAIAPHDDTIVMSFDLDAGLHGHGMDELAATHLSHSCIAFKDVVGTGKSQRTFNEIDLKAATRYAGEDADVTYRLWKRFKARLPAEGATRVYEMVDRPLIPVIARMETRGIKVDRAKLAGLSTEFSGQIADLEKTIHGIVGQPFTIGSPKQLGDILFEQMGIKGGRKGKSGVYSTDVNELDRIAADKDLPGAEIAARVLDWRQLSKLKSTYTDALQAQINPATGRVHTSYSLTGAQTGRLSSTDPNLQNIPIRTEVGRQIRDAFVAEPGNVILAADYSQIELRLAAHMADVPALKQAFADGVDIHNLTAQELFGEVNRDTRGRAKTINFAILYGISRWGLAGRLDVTADEAQAMIDRYFERFPGINRYITETLTQVRERGFTETLFGRKTHFPRIKSKVQHERQGAERAAINAPIQGSSADIIKRAMIRMEPALAAAGLTDVSMLLQVHDELVFELPERDVEAAKPVIERVMATAAAPVVTLDVPLGIEIGTGASWGAAH
ncbi:DNA polymerase I [Sphingomonas oligophenolica]|uniref:DNA polymerase I n=1 Tax=Sphingomonas oligophenolica TaxID=301154 RepID=A0A502CC19_9SPHN|nr:DNA polymerase I [Sphingomonas oligophenolica]TPG10373.1 DNA polymerase I [Sphingomonas oligophenolica]